LILVLNIPPFSGAHHVSGRKLKFFSLFVIVGVISWYKQLLAPKGWHHLFLQVMRATAFHSFEAEPVPRLLETIKSFKVKFFMVVIFAPGFLTSPSLL
jgi:hypothetical protein